VPSSLFGKVQRLSQATVVSPEKSNRSPIKKPSSDRNIDNNCLACASINWLSQSATIAEIAKYVPQDDDIPKFQEDQLVFLIDKFTLQDIKQAYLIMSGKIGVDYTSVMLPYNACKVVVMSSFTSLIYGHRSMMHEDSKDAFR
jgi:hypothetical protein